MREKKKKNIKINELIVVLLVSVTSSPEWAFGEWSRWVTEEGVKNQRAVRSRYTFSRKCIDLILVRTQRSDESVL